MNAIIRQHWSFDAEVLTIFSAKGQIVGKQAYLGSVGSELVEEQATDLKKQLEGSISYGHPGLVSISHIGLDEYRALHLYFEGALTIEALKQAAEDDDSIRVLINLKDRSVPCIIRANPPRPIMIVGIDGAMLPAPIRRAFCRPAAI